MAPTTRERTFDWPSFFSRQGVPDAALQHLAIAFQRQADKYVPIVIEELKNVHSDLDAIRYTKAFADLMAKYEKR